MAEEQALNDFNEEVILENCNNESLDKIMAIILYRASYLYLDKRIPFDIQNYFNCQQERYYLQELINSFQVDTALPKLVRGHNHG